jgi:hypothetical protein
MKHTFDGPFMLDSTEQKPNRDRTRTEQKPNRDRTRTEQKAPQNPTCCDRGSAEIVASGSSWNNFFYKIDPVFLLAAKIAASG